MSFFKNRKKFTVTERDPTYRVKYLGNVQTAMMKGDGCVDKPTGVLWNNYMKTAGPGMDMKLNICATGLKAYTKEQGITEYRAHRISYCIAHPNYPRLFVWVYRHEGKKMKVELRCHAVLCKSEEKAKAMAVQLHQKLSFALGEFVREKTRRQNSRLTLQRTNSAPCGIAGVPMRKKFLSTGQNFKPPPDKMTSAPKLGSIDEDKDGEHEQTIASQMIFEEVDEEEEDDEIFEDQGVVDEVIGEGSEVKQGGDDGSRLPDGGMSPGVATSHSDTLLGLPTRHLAVYDIDDSFKTLENVSKAIFDLEIGNDIEELKRDERVQYMLSQDQDSDEDSSESGFSEQESREGACTFSGGSGSGIADSPEDIQHREDHNGSLERCPVGDDQTVVHKLNCSDFSESDSVQVINKT